MTPRITRIFRCRGCGQEQQVQVWETVNVTVTPDLKPRLLSGALLNFKCESCGHKATLQYPLLYHDMKNRAMFWMVQRRVPTTGVGFPGPTNLQAGYALRLVHDFNELIEKVLLLDAGIDDRLMELFKLRLRRHGHLARYPRRTKLYFHGIDQNEQGQPQINLLILAGDAETHLVTREDDYRASEQQTVSSLPPIDAHQQEWHRIDQQFARRVASRHSEDDMDNFASAE